MAETRTKTYASDKAFNDDAITMANAGWSYDPGQIRRVPKDTEVVTYNNADAFNGDASKRTRDGWTVVSQTEKTRNPGCLGVLLTGGFRLIFKPKPQVIVSYQRSDVVVTYTKA